MPSTATRSYVVRPKYAATPVAEIGKRFVDEEIANAERESNHPVGALLAAPGDGALGMSVVGAPLAAPGEGEVAVTGVGAPLAAPFTHRN